MDPEEAMPVGNCVVCDDPLDFDESGFCAFCKGAFCWSMCGGWDAGKHACLNCTNPERERD